MFLFLVFPIIAFAQTEWFPRSNVNSLLTRDNVSIAFISQNLKTPSSMFGHTFLVFHNEFPPEPDALVVEFLGDTSSGGTAYLEAITSSIKGNYLINRFIYKTLEYDVENRDIWIYQLNISKEEKVNIVKELKSRMDKNYSYSFLFFNCSFFIYELIEAPLGLSKISAFPYTIPIHTIRKMDSQGRLKKSFVLLSSQHKAKEGYDLLSVDDKQYVKNVSELKSLEIERLKVNANAVLANIINFKIKRDDDYFKRNQYYEIKKTLLSYSADDVAIVNLDPKNTVSESSLYLGIGSRIESRYNLIIKPAMRDFFSAMPDGLESTNFDISKLWLGGSKDNLNINRYNLIKLENYTSESLLSDSFNRYFDLSYYDWSPFTTHSESEYVARFGSGLSSQWGTFKLGLMPYFGIKIANTNSRHFKEDLGVKLYSNLWLGDSLSFKFEIAQYLNSPYSFSRIGNLSMSYKFNLPVSVNADFNFFNDSDRSKVFFLFLGYSF